MSPNWVGLAVLLTASVVAVYGGTCEVNANVKNQDIDGFGFSSAWCGTMPATKTNALFGTLGMSILRIRIDQDQLWADETNNARVAHSYNATVFGTAWSPPPAWNTNGKWQGGYLQSSHYADYAAYLKRASSSIGLDYVSPANEPDYMENGAPAWTGWTADQLYSFVKTYANTIGTPLIYPESFQFRDVMSDPLLNDPAAVGLVPIIGGHFYGAGNTVHTNALNKGKHVWMTEMYHDGHDIDTCMVDAQEVSDAMNNMFSAYVWWWVYDLTDPTNLVNKDGTIYKNGYTLGQFAKFIPKGSRRIGSSPYQPTTGVSVTAYTTPKGQIVIVAVNKGSSAVSQPFTLTGISGVTSMTVTRTSGSENMASVAAAAVANNAFTYSLPAQSITTFVSNGGTPTPTPTPSVKCTAGYTQLVNQDAPNNDLSTTWGVTSIADCQTICTNTAGCVMFTFNAGLKGCWTKSAVGPVQSATGFTASVCSGQCTAGFTQMVDQDAANNDISTTWGITSYADCQTICTQTPGCAMFTFNAGLKGCWTKSKVGTIASAAGFTAGVCNVH